MSNFFRLFKNKIFPQHYINGYCIGYSGGNDSLFSLSSYTRHGSGVPVPRLKGLNVDKAIALLKEQGFNVKIDSVFVPDQAPGTVVEQDPDAGTNVKEGRTIYLNHDNPTGAGCAPARPDNRAKYLPRGGGCAVKLRVKSWRYHLPVGYSARPGAGSAL